MKNIIRIPTVTYGYIETEFEGTADEAIDEHNRLILEYKLSTENEGLKTKDWNPIFDKYTRESILASDDWERMSTSQKYIINELKKSYKRQGL